MFCTLMTVASIRFTWWNSALALAVNIGANLLLIPRFGILGAGIASLASELVQTAIDLAFLLAALGQVFVIGWWTRLAVASLCASAVVYAPIDADRIWLLLPAALVFFGLMRLMRAIPGNPLPVVHAEAAIIQTAQAAPA
jgi:O-antigen/teichoic acid export membrane protein